LPFVGENEEVGNGVSIAVASEVGGKVSFSSIGENEEVGDCVSIAVASEVGREVNFALVGDDDRCLLGFDV